MFVHTLVYDALHVDGNGPGMIHPPELKSHFVEEQLKPRNNKR